MRRGGYVQRNKQLKAAVEEAERINRPVIIWPEDVGHITPADLPLIDLKVAEREFHVIERQWLRDDESICRAYPGRAYARVAVGLNIMGDSSEVVTFRPKTADECRCDEDREANLLNLAQRQKTLIETLGITLSEIAREFMSPDISIFDYPHINKLLDVGFDLQAEVDELWERARGNDDAGKAE
jgi:hypothetical protein